MGVIQARDAFFKCVEADSGHTTPTEIASVGLLYPAQCKSARAFYEQNCRSTWVSSKTPFHILPRFNGCLNLLHSQFLTNIQFCVCWVQVKHFDRQFCAKKRVKRLLDTGDRARGPINLPANRVGLQPGEQ